MHNYSGGGQLLILGIITILYVMFTWWRDIIREALFEGQHTIAVLSSDSRGQSGGGIGIHAGFRFQFFWE